ncbi:glycoside hydrolase family 10 protein [Nostoc sp. FACHB-152]|uniref:glycoside hydrolase family 10 protein n=1 Tax=unclassified Nostoc TaxID=2593658 RepID=UPI0016835F8B|nr:MULTISPECIES: glycoside hydrolase family 10 protein [unclassified Nostoc]MBD2448850.1 glycoside hydrolase family 10 protein [Nostoc sp. FACHB-152]MBD2469819.1 glycoside hydrolase family 10 protein [Nostoc sp. FACHB-145]
MTRLAKRLIFSFISLIFILCLTLIYLPLFSVSSQPSSKQIVTEIRGVWLTNVASGVLFVPWGIDRAINQLSALHFNTIYPVVWNRGNTFYKSEVAKSIIGSETEPVLNFMHGGQDVLDKLIKLAKPKGLTVIPWFEYGLMTPPNSKLVKLYPDWLTVGQQGVDSIKASLPEENNGATSKQAWLNPLHPQVQEFILGLILEVVSRYNVDGIQLDDHFGMPVQFGYDRFTVQLYQQEHQGKSPPKNPYNSEWMRWRADKITAFMGRIYRSIKEIDPNAKLSLSPNAQAFAYKYYLQDWDTWVKNGWVDELVLQVYRHNKNSFMAELEQPAVKFAQSKIPVVVGISTGTLRTPVRISQIKEQIDIVRDRSFVGMSFFYWESLWGYISPEAPHKRRRIFSELFQAKAIRPLPVGEEGGRLRL